MIKQRFLAWQDRRADAKFKKNREVWLRCLRERLTNKDFTIISNNCISGVIYHDLNLAFDSPTINLFFKDMSEYILFLQHLDIYTSCPVTDVTEEENRGYPCGRLEPEDKGYKPLILCFMHYDSFENAKAAWERRCCRIHPDNLYLIFEFYNGLYDDQTLLDFDKLPYQKKVALLHKPVDGISCAKVVHCYKHESDRGTILEYDGISGKRFLDEFDYVTFLNS